MFASVLYARPMTTTQGGGVLHQIVDSRVQQANKILDPIGSKFLQKWGVKKILNHLKTVSIGLKIKVKIYTKCLKSVN